MRFAALDSQGWWEEGVTAPPLGIAWEGVTHSVAYWLGAMTGHGVDVLYVHASALELLGLPAQLKPPRRGESVQPHPWVDGVEFRGERVSRRTLAPSIECGGREIMVAAWQESGDGVFEDARDGLELLQAAVAFRDAFARPWAMRNSAGVTGWKLMHAPWSNRTQRGRKLALTGFDQNEQPAGFNGAQVEQAYGSWCRPEGELDAPLGYAHAYDVNGQRLAACARLSLGIGGLEDRDGSVPFDPKLPGYHLVKTIEQPHEGLIPPLMEPGWHTTPRVAMAEYLNIPVTIERSHVWTEHSPYLNPWYEQLRDARLRLMGERDADVPGAALALDALKPVYLRPLGQLRSLKAKQLGSVHYRPSWYDSVIGQELAREYLRLHMLADLGVTVLAVYFDAIVVESNEPDPALAAQSLPLELSAQLGKYKRAGTMPAGEARAILYAGEQPDVGAMMRGLKIGLHLQAVETAISTIRAVGFRCRPVHGGYPGEVIA